MTDLLELLHVCELERDEGIATIHKLEALNAHWGEEVLRLGKEITTLRNFLGAIQHNVTLALGDYGQPTGETDMAKIEIGSTYRWVVPPGEGK